MNGRVSSERVVVRRIRFGILYSLAFAGICIDGSCCGAARVDDGLSDRYEDWDIKGWLEKLAAYRRGDVPQRRCSADACLAREEAAMYQCMYLGQES